MYYITEMFDYAIIDEVCKATLPEILIPLSISKRAILVGDPQQLPPVFCSEDLEIIRSIEKCNLNNEMYIDKLFNTSDNTVVLNIQYRMEKKIGQLISDLFYSGTLLNGRNYEKENSLIWVDYNPVHMWPEERNGTIDKPIIRNLEEVQIIDTVLCQISDTVYCEKTVAVISPYRQQVYELRTRLSEYEHLNITIDTVDGFQGKESDIVIFGVTRTTGPFRFLSDKRRLNVALSRARDQIVIVGAKQYARNNFLLSNIISACKIQYYESR